MLRYFFIFLVIPQFCSAQYQVTGSVVKPDGSWMRSMSVILKKQSQLGFSRTSLTDSFGVFAFNVDTGSYELRLQSVFYYDSTIMVTVNANDRIKNLGIIKLHTLSKTLSIVTVTAKKAAIEFKDDHIVFNPDADPSIGARPVTEILNRIPGIELDSKNRIMAKGQEGVQLLVNGKVIRTPAGDYLAQLRADEVERVEVYDNATRFSYIKSPVIINVILKNRQQKKLWNAAINTNTLPKVNPSIDAALSFGKQRIYTRLSHDVSVFRSEGYYTRTADTFKFYQDFNNRLRHLMTMARIGWDYQIDSITLLTAEGNFTRHNDQLNAGIKVKGSQGEFQNIIHSSPIEKELAGSITYKKDLKQKGYIMFETGLTRFSLVNRRNLPGLLLTEQRNMNNYSFGFKAEWQKNIKKFKILNGVFGQLIRITDHLDTSSIDYILKSKFLNNSITSYHEGGWQIKKWNISVGANIDYIEMNLNRSGKKPFTYQRMFVNPSFKLNRVNGPVRTSFSYNRKYILPGTHMMFGQYNQYEFGRSSEGNYSLKPAVQDLVKLSFTTTKKATLFLEIYYDMTRNPVMMLYEVNGWFITDKPQNLKSRESIGAVISLSYTPRPFYSFTFNMDGRMNDHKLEEGAYVLNPRTWSASSTLINRFTLNKKLSISLNASMHNWRTTLYREMNRFVIYTVQGNYKLNSRTNISFGVNDIFKNMQFTYSGVVAPGFYESGFTKNNMRNISLSVRYQLINSQLDKKTVTVKSFMSE